MTRYRLNQAAVGVLRRWALLGFRSAGCCKRTHDWVPVGRLVQAAESFNAVTEQRVRRLLADSDYRLRPLRDPLATDFATHRWLAAEREESYSDWLQWVFRQVRPKSRVFRLLDVYPPAEIDAASTPSLDIEREVAIPQGHAGQAGRLDLVVQYGDSCTVVVEVKTTGADDADTDKQRGYREWLNARPGAFKAAVLLATEATEVCYEGFHFLAWADMCHRLRQLARDFCNEERVVEAALCLSFVGAVEQNLLGLTPLRPGHRLPAVTTRRLESHLTRWLDLAGDDTRLTSRMGASR